MNFNSKNSFLFYHEDILGTKISNIYDSDAFDYADKSN